MALRRAIRWPVIAICATALLGPGASALAAAPSASTPRHAREPAALPEKSRSRPFVFPTMPTAFVTLRPTTTTDVFEAADLVAPGSGRLSLREAFALANRLGIESAIVLERGAVYRLERCGGFAGPPDEANELVHTANKTLTINGNAATIYQDCDGAGVIVQQGGTELLNLVDLTIRGGRSRHSAAGAVLNSGTGEVRITNTVVVDNEVAGAGTPALSAGGVASNGDVIISGSTFARNRADAGVGAVAAAGAVKAIKSSFYDNGGARAGAIAAGGGGARPPRAGPPPFTGDTPAGVTLVYSTLSANTAPSVRVTGGALTSFASVIVASRGPLCEIPAGQTHSLGRNFSSGTGGCGFSEAAGDLINSQVPTLALVTGMKHVQVPAPQLGSPLIDAIGPSECLPERVRAMMPVYSGGGSDQLGVPRPQGSGCDMGAIEFVHVGSLARPSPDPPPSGLPLPTRYVPAALDHAANEKTLRVATTQDLLGGQQLSLRDAFAAANRADGSTRIVLEPHQIYRLSRCAAPQSAIDNETNDLIYLGQSPLTIEGNGSAILQTCDGSGVLVSFSDAQVTLQALTISGGRSVIHPGGGIYMAGAGELRLERSWITDNQTVAAGGGIAAFGDVTLLDSTVSNNHSTEVGGGIIATADVTAISSSLFDNTADLAIGAIGNHSGRLMLLFTTIAHNTAPNVAVGSLDSFGSIIADYLAPAMAPPAFSGPGGVHDGPPPGAGNGALKPGDTLKPPPQMPGGFPAPANCGIEHAGTVLAGNIATDSSCAFAAIEKKPLGLVPNRERAAVYLIPRADSPVAHLLSADSCAPFSNTLDQSGRLRASSADCASGAVQPR